VITLAVGVACSGRWMMRISFVINRGRRRPVPGLPDSAGDRPGQAGGYRHDTGGPSVPAAGQAISQTSHMTARSAQHEAQWFTSPQQVNQRRYETLRAYFVDGLSYAEAGARFGYTRWAVINLVREHRAGKLELFAPPHKPGPAPGSAPAKDRVRGRVIGLRRQGLSTYEISRRPARCPVRSGKRPGHRVRNRRASSQTTAPGKWDEIGSLVWHTGGAVWLAS
jgi:hypothetical protein